MNDLDNALIETSLQDMVRRGHFNICTIDQILKITKGVPNQDVYKRLHLLHCVNFNAMPPAVLEALPGMIREVLNGPQFNLDDLIDITPGKSGSLRLITK